MSWALDGRPIHSILVSRLRYLGDIVMSTPVLEVLREGDSNLDLGYLCEDGFADVLNNHPALQRVHRLHSGRTGSDARARSTEAVAGSESLGTLAMMKTLSRTGYDLAVDLFFNPRSAWLLKLAGIPRRVGGTRKWRGRLYTHQVLGSEVRDSWPDFSSIAPGGLGEHLCRLAPLTHLESGESFLDRLMSRYKRGDLRPRVAVPTLGEMGIKALAGLGVDPADHYLLLAPNATWRSKEWPLERWCEAIGLLAKGQDYPVIVLSAPGRGAVWEKLAAAIPVGRGGLLPPLPLREALAVTGGARGVLTVDGGLMHAAVAMRVPTLALFGPTDPAIWFPYEQAGPFRVLARAPHCHPCNLHECPAFICLPELEPTVVMEAFENLLIAAGPGDGGIR